MDLPDEDELIMAILDRVAAPGGNAARFVTGRLKKDVKECVLSSELSATAAVALVQQLIDHAGGALHGTAQLDGEGVALRGVIGTGIGGLNPAVVTVTVRPKSADGTSSGSSVHIRAAAKEGLIKQHGGRKAADRMAETWSGFDPSARLG